jgi:ribose/xylose/arabinose/galactoside ABC-type transport system permease subunit
VSGLFTISQTGVVQSSTGRDIVLQGVGAAVVGGVSLFGGTGAVPGAMIGAVLIAAVSNGMNVLNVSSYWQSLVIGAIILLGVSFDTYRRGLSGRSVLSALTSTSGQAPKKETSPVGSGS